MKIVTRYSDLFHIPDGEIQKLMENEFLELWDKYGGSSGLMDYQLGALGESVYLEDERDTADLSSLGYKGRFTELLFEFIEKKGEVYKAVLIRDNDGGTVFYSKAGTLDDRTEAYLKNESERK